MAAYLQHDLRLPLSGMSAPLGRKHRDELAPDELAEVTEAYNHFDPSGKGAAQAPCSRAA